MDTIAILNTALTGRYELEREIGAGGMATVYLARDVRHGRHVAVKVLNPELGAVLGPERFLAEIRVTAHLQHPNLLPLFDSGEADGLLYYVMPFVDGESLRARLDREKQLSIDVAVHIAAAVAGALDHAHTHGVIHRDLKPENILLQGGQPVVADFGIALAVSRAGGARVTQTGLSLGTPQYMSPEQATGDREIDGRSDVYSLGAVTYEMLVGEPPHSGATVQAIVARVLTDVPRSVRSSRPNVPEHVDYAVHRALEKLPADRWATPHEFAACINGEASFATARGGSHASHASHGSHSPKTRLPASTRRLAFGAAGAAALLGAAFLGWWMAARSQRTTPTVRFPLSFASSEHIFTAAVQGPTLAISPDGNTIAYLTSSAGSRPRIWLRSLDAPTPRVVAGTEGAFQPFFSPDGRWLAFIIEGQLKKLSLQNGTVVRVADVGDISQVYGVTWTSNDRIVIGLKGALFMLSATAGSAPTRLAIPAPGSGANYRWPRAVPNTDIVLFDLWKGVPNTAEIAALSLGTGKIQPLAINGTAPLGVLDQTLIYVSATPGAIFGVPFDRRGLHVAGAPTLLIDSVAVGPTGGAMAAISGEGSVVYQVGSTLSQLVLTDTTGASQPVLSQLLRFSYPRFAPDGKRIAVSVQNQAATDIHIYDIAAGTLTRLTTAGTSNDRATWTPDGKRVAFRSLRRGSAIWSQPADGSGAAAVLLSMPGQDVYEADLSADGASIAYRLGSGGASGIWWRAMQGDTLARPFAAAAEFVQWSPRFSRDGRWIAYASDESGKLQVYVRPFPGPGPKVQISVDGGVSPVWSADGGRLFYRNGSELLAAVVATAPNFSVRTRRVLFTGEYLDLPGHADYDVAPDGKHFLMLKPVGNTDQVLVAHNWIAEVRAKMAKGAR